jgi:hypothetical protein
MKALNLHQVLLNKAQFQQLIDNYANHIIEGLDNDSMEIMLFELITAEYETYTEEQIIGEVTDIYGAEIAQELLEALAGDQVDGARRTNDDT